MRAYLTHEDYLYAVQGAGVRHLDESIPIEERKLFPFTYFRNFSEFDKNQKPKTKYLECADCGEKLNEWGNGLYYCAFIIFDSPTQFYASCPDCKRKRKCYDFHEQKYGHPEPMILGELAESQKHRAVYVEHFGGSNKYKLWNYPKGLTMSEAKEVIGFNYGGCSFEGGFLWYQETGEMSHSTSASGDDIWKMKPPEVLKAINKIIEYNVSSVAPQDGAQLKLF